MLLDFLDFRRCLRSLQNRQMSLIYQDFFLALSDSIELRPLPDKGAPYHQTTSAAKYLIFYDFHGAAGED